MSPRSANRFNQREVARALKAARLAGETVGRVEIDPRSGKISMILANGGEPAQQNEWDEEIARMQASKDDQVRTLRRRRNPR